MYILIGGGGDIGFYLTKALLDQGHEVLLLEKGAGRYQALNEELGPCVVRGDACEARTMDEAGVARANVVIAVTGDDEDNLVICQMAKQHFNVANTIARLNNPKHEEIFQKLGINITVSPTQAILSLIEAELPTSNFISLMTLKRAGLEIVEFGIPKKSPVVGEHLRDINLPHGCNLALIIRQQEFIFPSADTRFSVNDRVYALVNREGADTLRTIFGVN